ncbi:MAG: hypothetical protein ABMA15_15170 [Vicinamibacterales bacterium]
MTWGKILPTPLTKPSLVLTGGVGRGSPSEGASAPGVSVAGMLGKTIGDVAALQTEGAAVATSAGRNGAGLPG